MAKNNKTIHVLISGRVQGVFFRYFTKKKADELGLVGWVNNRSDGRVEAVFQGKKEAVDEIVKWCYKGSSASKVEKVTVKEEKVQSLDGFVIRD